MFQFDFCSNFHKKNSMNREDALQIFNKGLDKLLGLEGESFIHLVWFAEDFEYFVNDFLEQIFLRIENPPYIEKIKSPQPLLPLIRLLFTIMNMPTLNKDLIYNRVPEIINATVRHNDKQSYELLMKLFDYWTIKQMITPQLYTLIRTCFESQRNLPWTKHDEVIKEEPVPRHEEIIEESQEQKKMKFRPWMLNAQMWDRGNSEDLSGIVFNEAPKAEKTRKFIKVTPENENATCSVCGGKFKTENNPKYGLVFVGVEKIKGSGYVHTSCKSHISGFLFS